jgi:hypothetical protein
MPAAIAVYLITWVILAFTAKPMARRLGNPGSWPVVPILGALGAIILIAASWPWPSQGRGQR